MKTQQKQHKAPKAASKSHWPRRTRTQKQAGLEEGWRSGLEERVAEQLRSAGVSFEFEKKKIEYTRPAKVHKYAPDFELANGVIVETKGRFVTADRQKHIMVKQQHPHLDIRFLFSNSKARISKTSSTTYAMWCEKNGFLYADKTIPEDWLK